MSTETTPSMKHLVIDRIEVRRTQNKVKAGFVKMQLICRDSTAKSGKTAVFFQVQAADDAEALVAAKAKFKNGDEVAARAQMVENMAGQTVETWHYYATTEEVNREEFLNNRAAQARLAEAKALANIAPRQYTEQQLAEKLI